MSGIIASKVTTDEILMYLDAGNAKSFAVGATVWNDVSRGNKDGVLLNGATFSTANNGTIVFDGIDDFVQISTGPNWFPMSTTAISFDAWIKTSGVPGGNTVNGIISLTYGITLSTTINGNVYFRVYDNNLLVLNNLLTTGLNCNDNRWHHIVGTNDGATSKIYVDGVFITSISAPFYGDVITAWYGSTCGVGIEANNTAVTRFNGSISMVKVYGKALSATEVLQNYNATKTRYI